ncbi:type II toxin-antitoxin system HicB family antitoxin [Candidatus Gottesmanbacteria bacterium]|nr:type II toxin-antitoxin system HicB family antitoxin [Candidatus Gottesmanbacteria bacterium]
MKTTILTYRTIIQKDGKYYHGFVPALPGCHTQGATIEETQENLKEAMKAWIGSRRELGWPVPEDDLIETLQTITIPADRTQWAYA